jgi:hypothetical protein
VLWSLSLGSALAGELSAPADANAPTPATPAVQAQPPEAPSTVQEGPARGSLAARDRTGRIAIESLAGLGSGLVGALVGALFGQVMSGNRGAAVGAIAGSAGGMSLGIWAAGERLDGDGRYWSTLLGTLLGGAGLAVTSYYAIPLGEAGHTTPALLLTFGGYTLPLVGGVLGYELTSPVSRTLAGGGGELGFWLAPAAGGGASAGVRGTFF